MLPPPVGRPDPTEVGGLPILRTDPAAEHLRQRAQRPARLGRYALTILGAVTAGAGGALWRTQPSTPALAFIAFGALMVGLGLVQDRLLRREQTHRPVRADLWEEGVELVLANGELRAASWSDPDFALDLYLRPTANDGAPDVLVAWRMDPGVPLFPISLDGSDRLRQSAANVGLRCVELTAHGRKRGLRAISIFAENLKPPRPMVPAESERTAP
jgi:hypothetical protein